MGEMFLPLEPQEVRKRGSFPHLLFIWGFIPTLWERCRLRSDTFPKADHCGRISFIDHIFYNK